MQVGRAGGTAIVLISINLRAIYSFVNPVLIRVYMIEANAIKNIRTIIPTKISESM